MKARVKKYLGIPFIRQVVLYGIIGGGCALLDISLFALLYTLLGVNEYIANVISMHVGMGASFLLNRRFNFKKTDKTLLRAISFYLTGLFGLSLSQGLLWLGDLMSLSAELSKFISIFFVAAVQFLINRSVTFRK